MSDAMLTAATNIWAWRLVIFNCFNNWFTVVGTSLSASNIASNYSIFSVKFTVILLALIAGSKAIEAFMNQDLGKLKSKFAREISNDITDLVKPNETKQTV